MSRLTIVGCVSLDTIHVEKNGIRTTYETLGGAGLYTALAGRVGGARVTLFAPKPSPMPRQLEIIASVLDWYGPSCEPKALPQLEIAHHGGGKATLLNASWGAESLLLPEHLPEIKTGDIVHIAALSSARSQHDFLTHCRQQTDVSVSVGTYAKLVYQQTAEVRQLFDSCDLFFMNDNEARGLLEAQELESIRQHPKYFVTAGENGATVYNGEKRTAIAVTSAIELDPTGAGDTFCGATLAHILMGTSLENAARYGCAIASLNVAHVGPTELLRMLQ
jgi:sugar/nucleoside kinase (ribokinase family)